MKQPIMIEIEPNESLEEKIKLLQYVADLFLQKDFWCSLEITIQNGRPKMTKMLETRKDWSNAG